MTDAIQLIGIIYKYAKIRNIPANEFEQIIMRSYEIAWKLQSNRKGTVSKSTKPPPFADLLKEPKKNQLLGKDGEPTQYYALPMATANAIQSYGLMQIADNYFGEDHTKNVSKTENATEKPSELFKNYGFQRGYSKKIS